MPRTFEQVLAGFSSLKPEDFDGSVGEERLYELTEDLLALPNSERGIRAMFDLMERMPEADLGSPGPLVHALEQMRGHYESELVESVKRSPTFLTIWMINRILNGTRRPEEREPWLNLLRSVAENPAVDESAKQEAKRFVEYQRGST